MKEKIFDIHKYSSNTLINILWQLCYMPDEELNVLRVNDISSKELIDYIIDECSKSSKLPFFGNDTSCVDTHGIDLGIKNNIVRDIVIKRCFDAVFSEQHIIKKAIKLLKTEDDGSELNSRRLCGGLKEIGFSNKEANYIKDTCNCYAIALLLEKYEEELEEEIESEDADNEGLGIEIPLLSEYDNTNRNYDNRASIPAEDVFTNAIKSKDQYESHVLKAVAREDKPDTAVDTVNMPLIILENKELIKRVLLCKFDNINDISNEILKLESIIEQLKDLKNDVKKLEEVGVTLYYINEKKEEINGIISIAEHM